MAGPSKRDWDGGEGGGAPQSPCLTTAELALGTVAQPSTSLTRPTFERKNSDSLRMVTWPIWPERLTLPWIQQVACFDQLAGRKGKISTNGSTKQEKEDTFGWRKMFSQQSLQESCPGMLELKKRCRRRCARAQFPIMASQRHRQPKFKLASRWLNVISSMTSVPQGENWDWRTIYYSKKTTPTMKWSDVFFSLVASRKWCQLSLANTGGSLHLQSGDKMGYSWQIRLACQV